MDSWWANVESNHRPPAYQAGALTAELLARSPACAECGEGMTLSIDLKRFSLPWATEVALNCLPERPLARPPGFLAEASSVCPLKRLTVIDADPNADQ
jgi:hypothetical protein